MKYIDLLNSQNALGQLAVTKMPGSLAYKVAKNIRIVSKELDVFNAARDSISKKYELKFDDDGVAKPGDNTDAANKEYRELTDTEIAITPHKIPLSDIGNIELEPAVLLALDWIFDETSD